MTAQIVANTVLVVSGNVLYVFEGKSFLPGQEVDVYSNDGYQRIQKHADTKPGVT